MISAADRPEIAEAIRSICDRIPVITLATDIADCGRLAYIGPDDRQTGRLAGDLLATLMGPQGGHILVVAGRMDISGQRARAQGLQELITERHPQCWVTRMLEAGEDCDATEELVGRASAKIAGSAVSTTCRPGDGVVAAGWRGLGGTTSLWLRMN